MKQETTKKSKKWLWLVIALAVLVAAAAVVLALVLGGQQSVDGPTGGRPDLYWNVDRIAYTSTDGTGLSTREPEEDGIYRIRFAYNGEQVEYPVADKRLINYIDTMEVMGLVFDEEGFVVDAKPADEIAVATTRGIFFVQRVTDSAIYVNSSIAMNGMQTEVKLTELTEIYDVTQDAEVCGQTVDADVLLAMDGVYVFANDLEEITHVFLASHPQESKVYWRAVQYWDSKNKATSRVPDENGVYSIDFCCDGGIVTLKCKDASLVSTIDNKSPHSAHFGFAFDEEGYIVEILDSAVGIRGMLACERCEVLELDGNYFSAAQQISGDSGNSYSATLPEDCVIYDASKAAIAEGRQGQAVESLQLGDRICVWTDTQGNPVLVYIANRLVDCTAYFNMTRKYDSTVKETTREPDAQGYYSFEVVAAGTTGKQTVKTNSKEFATLIDSQSNRTVGLVLNGNIIERVYESSCIYGWTSVGIGSAVGEITGPIVSVMAYGKRESALNFVMDPSCKVYDVSGVGEYGEETMLRLGDIAYSHRKVTGEVVCIFVTRRVMGGDTLYYNLDHKYDSKAKTSTREPEENGWYVFNLIQDGKRVTVKTKDKALVDQMDAADDLTLCLEVRNGIVYKYYASSWAYGQRIASGYRVKQVNGDGTVIVRSISSGKEVTLTLAEDCKIYNVSQDYNEYRGEQIWSLKEGDMVASFADIDSQVKVIYVRNRYVENMYYNTKRMYDSVNKTTARESVDGWYYFDLVVNGQIKTFKTDNKELAGRIDAYSTPFGLRVDGDVIRSVVGPNWVRGVYKAGVTEWDVTAVSGSRVTIRHNKPGYTTTGQTQTFSLTSGVKVYDISPAAEQIGQKATLQVGDRIRTYVDEDGDCVYVYILFKASREKGTTGYCEHCKQEVYWHPWAGGSWDGVDCHYYLAGDVEVTTQAAVGNTTKQYEVVLDLNGKSLQVNGIRGLLVYRGDTLSILDSVGGGEIAATGLTEGNGGVVMVSGEESTLNLYGGTLRMLESDEKIRFGGVAYLTGGATMNMYGGTVADGCASTDVSYALGGNIYLRSGSTFNLYGGTVQNGKVLLNEEAAQGGNIYAVSKSTVNISGGKVIGGNSEQDGGNIYLSTSTLNMNDGLISGGTTVRNGGNIYCQKGCSVNISGGVVENGNAPGMNGNLFMNHENAELTVSGGTISGDLAVNKAASVTVSGAPKITIGSKTGLSLGSDVRITLGALTKGAEITVNAKGVFTQENKNAADYLAAGYFKPATSALEIREENDVLIMEGKRAYCEHCQENVSWYEWPGTSSPASGHYYISDDYTGQTTQWSIAAGADVVLDLQGHSYITKDIRNFLVRGSLSIMDTVGGGKMVSSGRVENDGNASIAMISKSADAETIACFNLYSGTLMLAEDHNTVLNGGVLYLGGEAVFNMYGGTICGGVADGLGGNIYAANSLSMINMYGGQILGGEAKTGGSVYCVGVTKLQGGTIDGDVYISAKATSTAISGSAVVGNLDLSSGALVMLEPMTDGAEINVTADGVFTHALTDAESYLPYIKSVNQRKTVQVQGDALAIVGGAYEIQQLNAVHTEAEKMTEDGVFAGGTVTAKCPYCGEEVQWEALTAITGTTDLDQEKHYYLASDLENSGFYYIKSNVCLHLNGHSITSTARAFYVESDVTLNIMGEGAVTGKPSSASTGGALDVVGTANLFGGTYSATNANHIVSVRGNTATCVLNMYEGAAIERTAEIPGACVRIYDHGDFNMYGGSVTGGSKAGDNGGNFVLVPNDKSDRDCTLNIYGGTVSNGSADLGGNIYAPGVNSIVTISGGSITEGSVYVAADAKNLTLSGAPVVSQLDLTSGKLATLGELTEGAQIGVIANGVFTEVSDNASQYLKAGYIQPAQTGTMIREENGALIMEVDKTYCEHCGESVVWTLWPGTSSPASGHYYISDDYTGQTTQWSIAAGADVVLDLQGHSYITKDIRNFLVRGSLSVMDTVGGGKMVSSGRVENDGNASIAMISKSADAETIACFNLYSGTLMLAEDHNTVLNGGVLYLGSETVFNMYGGTISGGAVSGVGGNIYAASATSVVNMYGGQILGGSAETGNSIYAVGTFYMEGGTVDGNVYVDKNAVSVSVSGTAVIGNLDVTGGTLVTLGELADGAKIAVTADGVFTNALTNADAYLAYITSADADKQVIVENDALAIKAPETEEISYNTLHTVAEKMTEDGVFANGDTVTAKCPYCGQDAQWEALTAITGTTRIQENKHYYLSSDLENSGFYYIMSNVCVHLNGHSITSTARAFYVESGAALNIMGEGTVTGKANQATTGGALDVVGAVNLFGGTYGAADDRYIIAVRGNKVDCVLNMYEGASIARTETVPGACVRIYDEGEFNLYGGSVTGGSVTGANGGNFCLVPAKNAGHTAVLNIYGGTVSGGSADLGGNIYASGATVSVNIAGGFVTDGDVYVASDLKEVVLSGACVVSNLDVTSGKLVTLGELTDGAKIAVTADGVFTEVLTDAEAYLTYIKSADKTMAVVVDNGALATELSEAAKRNMIHTQAEKMTEDGVFANGDTVTAKCPYCGQDAQWEALTAITGTTRIQENKHYYLSSDLENSGFYYIMSNVCVHLNGHSITSTARAFYVESGAALNIMGEGTVTGKANQATTGGALDVVGAVNLFGGTYGAADDRYIIAVRSNKADCVLNMYEGTSITRTSDVPGACVRIFDHGDFNMYGGSVSGGSVTGANGGNFCLVPSSITSRTTVLNICGGTVSGGSADLGGNIYASGATVSVNIADGAVTDGDVYIAADVKAVSVSGASVISSLDLTSGALLTMGELTDGANITVSANNGVFTAENAMATEYAAYFKSADAAKQISVENNTLVMEDAATVLTLARFFKMLCTGLI